MLLANQRQLWEVRGIHPKVFFSFYVYQNGFKSLTIQRYNRV